MTAAVFGFLSELREELRELVNNLLLVAGGFLLGYLLGGAIGWALGRWVFRQKTPETLRRLGRPVGGIILAELIVALIVFTGKGKPRGDGGDGKGTPATDSTPGKNAPASTEPDPKAQPKTTLPKIPDPKPADVIIQVTLFGGLKATNQQYYRLENEDQLRTFTSLQEAILARKARETGKLSLAIRLPPDPNDRPGDPRVTTQVTEWANAQGLDVTFPANR